MKKRYIIPEVFTISLSIFCPLATSVPDVDIKPGETPVVGDDLDVKGVADVNLWDNEW
ncbi:MAG: hypothetical protein IKU02_08970 [Bacteroidaceae bacterium]|nr:hypothetical protein [Bacteroidaceae bacterium]